MKDNVEERKGSLSKGSEEQNSLADSLNNAKKQLDDHLQAINENTCEIQSNYDFLCEVENKIDKLSERIDKIQLFLQCNNGYSYDNSGSFDIKPLTRNEQYVFLVLYALEEEKSFVAYNDIAKKTGFGCSLVRDYIASIMEKGVPIIKRYIHNRVHLKLNKEFKRLQAKENILMIDTAQKQLINF